VEPSFPSGQDSSPDEIGMKFSVPFSCKIGGFWWSTGSTGAVNYDVVLYDGDGSTVLKTVSFLPFNTGIGVRSLCYEQFDDLTLTRDVLYRLVFKPITGLAPAVGAREVQVNAAAMREHLEMGLKQQKTSRTNGGAWTEDDTRMIGGLGLMISALDDGAGGGMDTLMGAISL